MIDPGAVGSDQSSGQNRHWLVNGAKISGKCISHVDMIGHQVMSFRQMERLPSKAPRLSPNTQDPPLPLVLGRTGQCMGADYLYSPVPQRHYRYTIVVYAQGGNFTPPQDLSSPVQGVQEFSFPDYVKNSNLGPLVAGIYYQVEEGTATVSIPATSSVVSSTLPAAQPTNSGTSGTSSGPKPTSSGSNSNTSGAMGKAVSGTFLSLAAVLTYIVL